VLGPAPHRRAWRRSRDLLVFFAALTVSAPAVAADVAPQANPADDATVEVVTVPAFDPGTATPFLPKSDSARDISDEPAWKDQRGRKTMGGVYSL
jgi:hypothetical protein